MLTSTCTQRIPTEQRRRLKSLTLKNGLKAFALTDHDTMAGTGEIVESLKQLGRLSQCEDRGSSVNYPPLFVPGIEFREMQDDCEIHILGYFTEYDPPGLSAYIEEQAKSRERRNHAMLEKLRSLGYDIRLDDLMHYAREMLPGRSHGARLVAHGRPLCHPCVRRRRRCRHSFPERDAHQETCRNACYGRALLISTLPLTDNLGRFRNPRNAIGGRSLITGSHGTPAITPFADIARAWDDCTADRIVTGELIITHRCTIVAFFHAFNLKPAPKVFVPVILTKQVNSNKK